MNPTPTGRTRTSFAITRLVSLLALAAMIAACGGARHPRSARSRARCRRWSAPRSWTLPSRPGSRPTTRASTPSASMPGGTWTGKLDCNVVNGTWSASGDGQFMIETGPSTVMAAPWPGDSTPRVSRGPHGRGHVRRRGLQADADRRPEGRLRRWLLRVRTAPRAPDAPAVRRGHRDHAGAHGQPHPDARADGDPEAHGEADRDPRLSRPRRPPRKVLRPPTARLVTYQGAGRRCRTCPSSPCTTFDPKVVRIDPISGRPVGAVYVSARRARPPDEVVAAATGSRRGAGGGLEASFGLKRKFVN